jgi:hypothetical protein
MPGKSEPRRQESNVSTYDYAHNPVAAENRTAKAKKLATYLYLDRMPADVAAALDDGERRAAERAADVNRCSDDTWAEAIDRLRAGWELYGHTDDPPETGPDSPPQPATAAAEPDPVPEPPAALATLTAPVSGPVVYACGYGRSAYQRCRRTPAEHTRAGHRCADHLPDLVDQPDEAPGRYCLRICYCGSCPQWQPPVPGLGLGVT